MTTRGIRLYYLAANTLLGAVGQAVDAWQPEKGGVRTDTPAGQPADRAPGSALNPRLDRERQVLAPLEGRWSMRVESRGGDSAAGSGKNPAARPNAPSPSAMEPTTGSAERTWVLDGSFLQEVRTFPQGDGAAGPGIAYWGFDRASNRYNLVFLEPGTGRASVAYGLWNPDARAIVFRADKGETGPRRVAVLRIVGDAEQDLEIYGPDDLTGPTSQSGQSGQFIQNGQPGVAPGANPAPAVTPPPAETPSGYRPQGTPSQGPQGTPSQGTPEDPSAPPGQARLPAMNPPESPESPADSPAIPLDERHLVMRIIYTRPQANQQNAAQDGEGEAAR